MTDRPISFKAPMVRALIRESQQPGTGETQTRRVLNPQPPDGARFAGLHFASDEPETWFFNSPIGPRKVRITHEPGDRLWVREAWAPLSALTHNDPGVQALADRGFYRADAGTVDGEISRWHPGIHMPRWASRITLTVTDVRVQRLQEINEADAIAEGIIRNERLITVAGAGGSKSTEPTLVYSTDPNDPDDWERTAIDAYRALWDRINAKRAPWDSNPWVVALTFTVRRGNIDQEPA